MRDEKLYVHKGASGFRACAPQKTVARLFGLSEVTVKQLCSQYESAGVVGDGVGRGRVITTLFEQRKQGLMPDVCKK